MLCLQNKTKVVEFSRTPIVLAMVLSQAAEERQQRILLKRERAKQEFLEQQKQQEFEAKNSGQDGVSEAGNSDAEVQETKKPKLDIPDSDTIVSNVYHYLKQEYKYLQLQSDNDPGLQFLAPITQRTSSATGYSKQDVRTIVRDDRERIAENKRREQGHSSKADAE